MNRFHVHLNVADLATSVRFHEEATVCCYAKSDKIWTENPQGTRWETFHTLGDATTYHAGDAACATDDASCTPNVQDMKPMVDTGAACCGPSPGCC